MSRSYCQPGGSSGKGNRAAPTRSCGAPRPIGYHRLFEGLVTVGIVKRPDQGLTEWAIEESISELSVVLGRREDSAWYSAVNPWRTASWRELFAVLRFRACG